MPCIHKSSNPPLRILYSSDFDFILHLVDDHGNTLPFPECDFSITLSTCGPRKFTVKWQSGVGNGIINDAGSVRVIADNHGLPPGKLSVVLTLLIPDSNYPDGFRRVVKDINTAILLVTSDPDDPFTSRIVARSPYLRIDAAPDYVHHYGIIRAGAEIDRRTAAVSGGFIRIVDNIASFDPDLKSGNLVAFARVVDCSTNTDIVPPGQILLIEQYDPGDGLLIASAISKQYFDEIPGFSDAPVPIRLFISTIAYNNTIHAKAMAGINYDNLEQLRLNMYRPVDIRGYASRRRMALSSEPGIAYRWDGKITLRFSTNPLETEVQLSDYFAIEPLTPHHFTEEFSAPAPECQGKWRHFRQTPQYVDLGGGLYRIRRTNVKASVFLEIGRFSESAAMWNIDRHGRKHLVFLPSFPNIDLLPPQPCQIEFSQLQRFVGQNNPGCTNPPQGGFIYEIRDKLGKNIQVQYRRRSGRYFYCLDWDSSSEKRFVKEQVRDGARRRLWKNCTDNQIKLYNHPLIACRSIARLLRIRFVGSAGRTSPWAYFLLRWGGNKPAISPLKLQ